MTKIGQNTGILKASIKVQKKAMIVLFVTDSQNLNSGSRRMNGLNSSVALVGRAGPLSSSPETKFLGIFLTYQAHLGAHFVFIKYILLIDRTLSFFYSSIPIKIWLKLW